MPRSLDPDLLAAMDSGNFVPYFNVQLMDEDRTSVRFETTEVVGFELNGLTAKVVFHDPLYWDDYYMFRIQRGISVDGVPNIITSSCYWPTYDRHENLIRTIEGHVFPSQNFTTPGDVTYASIIATVCAEFGFNVTHEDPAAAWLSYQFLPDGRYLVLNDARWFFTLLRQKYLVFATDYDSDSLYFFQAKSTGPTFPGDYTLLQANHVAITGHGAYKEKTLFSRDENNDFHYSGGTDKPIHNLGFLLSTASHPDNYSFIDTQNWIIQNIAPNLKYLDFDPVYVVLDFGEFSIWPTKFVEYYNSKLSPSWQWQARFLDVFGDTEGGSMTIPFQFSAPFTPLSTLNFDRNLNSTVSNLQALAEAVDELTTGPALYAAASKTVLDDADLFPLVDSDTSTHVEKTTTWANLKARLKSYFDSLYVSYTSGLIHGFFTKIVTDSVATSVFRITTTDETDNNDGGGYSVLVHALIGVGISSTTGSDASKSFTAQFCRAVSGVGIGVNSIVSEVVETASAATSPSLRDVTAITMTVLETSEYLIDVQFNVECSGSQSHIPRVIVKVELIWYGFLTAPVLSQL